MKIIAANKKRRYKQYSKWKGSHGCTILKKIETDCNCVLVVMFDTMLGRHVCLTRGSDFVIH